MDFLIFQIIILIFSIVLHEVSHGWVANSLGDPTAKNAGRLTLNPLPHIDPIGSLALPLFLVVMSSITGGGIIFGWAKPVPVNPANLRDQKWGSAMVSLAGPASNLAVALIFGLLLRFFGGDVLTPTLALLFGYIAYINILLAVFNLLPIPPLDGSRVFFSLLPASFHSVKIFLSQYGFIVLLLLVFFFFQVISLLVNGIFRFLVGSSLF